MPHEVYTKAEIDQMFAARDAALANHESRITALEGGSPPPPPPTATFTATPQTIEAGQTSLLEWTTTNATGVTLDGASVALNGSQSVTPTANQTYTLVATGPGGQVTKQVTVTVTQPSGFQWPGPDGDVLIPAGTTVVVDTLTAEARDVTVQGTLRFSRSVNSKLVVRTLMAEMGGWVDMGEGGLNINADLDPIPAGITAELVFRDTPLDTANDPEQTGNGLLAMGKVTMCGAAKTPFVQLSVGALAGHTVILLESPPTGWQIGDQVAIPDSRQLIYPTEVLGNWNPQIELKTIQFINGGAVTLTSPLEYDHLPWRDKNGVLGLHFPHMLNLSRNVKISSENPAGVRGHTMFMNRAHADIRHAQFDNMGRTTNEPLDSTTYDAQGNVTHIGTNQIGRYPVHFHHYYGPVTIPATGKQFVFLGCSVTNSEKWPVAVHDSHYGLVKDNVVYNAKGAGFVTEEGGESYNVIEGNFALRIEGTGQREGDRSGNAFHLSGGNNYVRNNIAACVNGTQDIYCYGYNLFFQGPYTPNGQVALIPAAQGEMPSVPFFVNKAPILEFSNNEVYNSPGGLAFWSLGLRDGIPFDPPGQAGTFINFRCWHIWNYGCFAYWTDQLVIDGFVTHNDFSKETGTGMVFGDYVSKNLVCRNFDLQGCAHGLDLPIASGIFIPNSIDPPRYGPSLFENGVLCNVLNVISTPLITASSVCDHITPMDVTLRNVQFQTPPTNPANHKNIYLVEYDQGELDTRTINLRQLHKITVENYNGVAGDNFRVYWAWQAPDFIMPQDALSSAPSVFGTHRRLGSPDSGKTNAQNWAEHGVAMCGKVCPVTTTRPLIDGFCEDL